MIIDELRAVAGPEYRNLITDLFEKIMPCAWRRNLDRPVSILSLMIDRMRGDNLLRLTIEDERREEG